MREHTKDFIEDDRRRYLRDRNPVYAWRAFVAARAEGLPIPTWVLEYFDRVGKGVLKIQCRYGTANPVANLSLVLAEALEMKPRGKNKRVNAFSKAVEKNLIRYGYTVAHYIKQGDKETFAIEAAAKDYEVSPATVRRAWKRFREEYLNDV